MLISWENATCSPHRTNVPLQNFFPYFRNPLKHWYLDIFYSSTIQGSCCNPKINLGITIQMQFVSFISFNQLFNGISLLNPQNRLTIGTTCPTKSTLFRQFYASNVYSHVQHTFVSLHRYLMVLTHHEPYSLNRISYSLECIVFEIAHNQDHTLFI